ncbi:MAG TPA: hypothetical protein DEG43_01175 [Acidimicrobiaceae bacterium]|jgi:AcrR family transcriptional regulator|nr:hypothetical protein [Acidimicrobiaceae bacterium]
MTDEVSVPERLLNAALEVAADYGLTRLSVGDVAKRAGLSRQTLYKHFATREDLIRHTVVRETGRIVERVIEAASESEIPEVSLELAILEALHQVRRHPLLDRLVATEPEALLPLLIDGDRSAISAVHSIAVALISTKRPEATEQQWDAAADLLSRLLVSYAIRPPSQSSAETARYVSAAVLGSFSEPAALTAVAPS